MRTYSEPTCASFLKEPQVLGVSLLPLLLLVFLVALIQVLGSPKIAALLGALGYAALRLQAKYAKHGAEESLIYLFERLVANPRACPGGIFANFLSPDTLDEEGLILEKEHLAEVLHEIRPNETKCLSISIGPRGAKLTQTPNPRAHLHSLYRLPPRTDPLWLSAMLRVLKEGEILLRFDGIDPFCAKKIAARARRRNANTSNALTDVESDVAFEESTAILEGLARGEEELIRASLVVSSDHELPLDPSYFCKEKRSDLPLAAISGERHRTHRAHYVRLKTAADLIPSFLDPDKEEPAILKTRRGFPLYFSPLDKRLEAPHWLVTGTTGSGKSFFTGLVLSRLVEAKAGISVLFIDHRRSFKRICEKRGTYLEPQSLSELTARFSAFTLDTPNSMAGVELVGLLESEKKDAARFLLKKVESLLQERSSRHRIYVVIDECWKYLKDDPMLVETTFREFRKLNGGAISIVHSLSDFLRSGVGEAVLQTATTRVLLRQGEDMLPHAGALELNEVELKEVRRLKQKRGEFSECLIKTNFSSQIGRLYPTEEEFKLLQTDEL